MPAESVHAIHVADQRLETFIRHADDELQLQLPCIAQAYLAALLVHLGKRLVQKYQPDLGIPAALLHVEHGEAGQQGNILGVLALPAGIPPGHFVHRVFLHIALFILHPLVHTECQIVAVICKTLHFLMVAGAVFGFPVSRRHEFFRQPPDLLLVFLKKCVLSDAELSLKSIVVQHLAVQFWCHQHFIKLSVLILGRKDVDLVGAVGKPDSGQHPVDLPPVPVRRLNLPVDGGDHIFPEGVVDQTVLVLKFLLILWLIVPL